MSEIIFEQADGSVIIENYRGENLTGVEIYPSEEEFSSRTTTEDLPAEMQANDCQAPEEMSVFRILLGMRLAIHNRRFWITHKDFEFVD